MLQKMRAGLAALGIFIGTTTVIWLVAMGEGVSHRAQQQILELGATNIIVRTKEPTSANNGQDANSRVKTYGLLRKTTPVPALAGLLIETALLSPLASSTC